MKNVYFSQVNVSYMETFAYLPYASACIAAYSWRDEKIAREYKMAGMFYLRKTVDETLAEIKEPYIVAFSNYIWNFEYNKELAKRVKAKYPDCIIVFGGHQMPVNSGEILRELPYADIVMHGEGERPFYEMLIALSSGEKLEKVHNISFRKGDEIISTEVQYDDDLSDYPSPYLAGYFDDMFKENPDFEFDTVLETDRGCPYGCAFCDWCYTKKLRVFPMEKIKAEITWMAEHKVKYCYCADSNFGINKRDVEIARFLVAENKRTGYPITFKPCYAKNSDPDVYEIGRLLNVSKIDKGVTLAYQSLDNKCLESIGRKNLTLEHFQNLTAAYSKDGIPTYTELIVGLPGETYESFCRGMCRLLEMGQHNSMTVYACQVYCNSPIGQADYQKKYGIRTEHMPIHGAHYPPNFNGVQEYYEIITSTKSMNKDMWVKANMFSVCLQCFHHLGLLRCFALYLRYEKGVQYYDFYNELLDYIYTLDTENTVLGKTFTFIHDKTEHTSTSDWCYQKDIYSKVGWYFEEGAFLECAHSGEEVWAELLPFLKRFDIESDIFAGLLKYQKNIIRLPGKTGVVIKSEYDFYNYFEDIYENAYKPLRAVKNELDIVFEKPVKNWADYAIEIIWYGKRWSQTLCTNQREEITFSAEQEEKQ